MTQIELRTLLEKISAVSLGVLGDFCLDVYLELAPEASECSVETGLPTQVVRQQRFSLGGAGNIAHNLAALGVRRIASYGVVGDDPYGKEMQRQLAGLNIDCDGLLVQSEDWATHVYMKPYIGQQEQQRIDCGNFNALHTDVCEQLLQQLEHDLPALDLVIINQQVRQGIYTEEFRHRLKALIQHHPTTRFITDSRHYSDFIDGTIRKINDHEGALLCGIERAQDEPVVFHEAMEIANALYQRWQQPVFLTRREHGCVLRDADGYHEVPGLQILTPTDPVGAGDSMLAGIAAALAAGSSPVHAAHVGNFVAGVTIQKRFQTGTASPQEILAIGSSPDYCYAPELASHPDQARYYPRTEIEIVREIPLPIPITHGVFDHDGTISTLRQGWDSVMAATMIRAVLGPQYSAFDPGLRQTVATTVQNYIDQSTGIRTLAQMQELVRFVRTFGCVPEEQILQPEQYKELFQTELLHLIEQRLQKFQREELCVEDLTIKDAIPFLKTLYKNGVKLYLVSGTDQRDVEREVQALGYGRYFEGRIYGARAQDSLDPKKRVLTRIQQEGGAQHIVSFGDGPVEMRETHKHGGVGIGIASDEVRRFGRNLQKRSRLIQAGASLIIPDYSQRASLLELFSF